MTRKRLNSTEAFSLRVGFSAAEGSVATWALLDYLLKSVDQPVLFRHEGEHPDCCSGQHEQCGVDLVLQQDEQDADSDRGGFHPSDRAFRHGEAPGQQETDGGGSESLLNRSPPWPFFELLPSTGDNERKQRSRPEEGKQNDESAEKSTRPLSD